MTVRIHSPLGIPWGWIVAALVVGVAALVGWAGAK